MLTTLAPLRSNSDSAACASLEARIDRAPLSYERRLTKSSPRSGPRRKTAIQATGGRVAAMLAGVGTAPCLAFIGGLSK